MADDDERFELLGELGRGGMAAVHLARDRRTGEQVALKVLYRHLADRPSTRRRLERELEAARRVQHPAIVHPLEQVEVGGAPALVLPALSGATLQDRVEAGGPLPEPELRRLLDDIGGALAAAHAVGVLHRDVTPRNVLWDDRPRLVDFGLARLAEQGTATTGALGTVGYAPPETHAGGATDPRSDAYALGAVLYFAATGRPPFDAPTAMGALQLQLDGELTPLGTLRPDLDQRWTRTIEDLLATEPEDRIPIPEALRLDPRPRPADRPQTRRQWTQVGSAASLAAAALVAWAQDLGAFGLATVVQGHAVPQGEFHVAVLGLSVLVLIPLSIAPAMAGAWAGRSDPERRRAPWVGVAALSALNLLYAVAALLFGLGGPMDLFGTMLFHLGAYLPLMALIVAACQPWRALSAPVAKDQAPRVPLADEARAALAELTRALRDAPEVVRLDLGGLVRELESAVGELGAELAVVTEALVGHRPDPAGLAALEERRSRALARGEPIVDHDRALEAGRRHQAEADALEARRIRAVAGLLEVRAEAARARRALLDTTDLEPVTTSLRALRQRAELAARAGIYGS